MTLAEFRRAYPTAAFTTDGGKPLTYRYYQNPRAKATLVPLTGGVVARVIAVRHPEVVEGLILSDTCSLSGSMSEAGHQDLMKIIESQRNKKWLAFPPFPLIKRVMKRAGAADPVRGRHHLHPGLPGGPDRPDARSHGGY